MTEYSKRQLTALAAAEQHLRRKLRPRIEFQLDPHVHHTVGGRMVVHGEQQYRGLSVHPHSFAVHLDGRKARLDGDRFITINDLDVRPGRTAADAVKTAFSHLREGGSDACRMAHARLFARRRYEPRPIAVFPKPDQPTVFPRGPFHEAVTANLVVHPSRRKTRLAWLVAMAAEDVADFTILVDARDSNVLLCTAEAASAICFANVFHFDPGEAAAAMTRFPRPLTDYSPGLRPALDFADWVATNATLGNNVETAFDNKKRSVVAVPGPNGGVFRPTSSVETQLVNAFFLCNFLHDFFSLIGFGEADGNFQEQNPSGSGIAGDRLRVTILPAAHGKANMRAQSDGKDAEMRLGKGAHGRSTALDAAIVIHEYAHGVSQRLVGGKKKKNALTEPQSRAMGEGWSDYFAMTILNSYRPQSQRLHAFAPWSSGKNGGERRHPYDSNFPGQFGLLGTALYREQHDAGSIFCSALLGMHEELQNFLDDTTGDEMGWKLVIASMKELSANPNFLDARDQLIKCATGLGLSAASTSAVTRIIRRAFAARGMGRAARCADSSYSNIHADPTP